MLTPGTTVGTYEIVSSLGTGGMGEVYRARDSRLGRDVALKILPVETAVDAARLERFSREARALAALSHPNIVTIYSTEEADGIRFLTMELVEGQPLDRLIPVSGMPVAQLLDIAVPLCDAIAAAHEKHLTHRDLKPANVMVSDDGRVKVLDFGLASFARAEREQPEVTRLELTYQGTVLGTAPYMSPEQVEGKTLDHRTDIFSLGIMLYEMATGTRPFQGDSSPALMSSILKDTPVAIRDVRPEVPGELGRLVARCLEKDPRDRVQTARDVFNELKLLRRELSSQSGSRVSPAAVSRSRYPMVAVAAFDARGAGDEAQTLAEGLAEDISAALSRFSYIRVGPRADARYLIEGTVRKAGTSLRITARLVDTTSGVHLWAETFNRSADADVFALQDELTTRIVATTADQAGVLVRSMAAGLADRPYDQLSATELVLRYFVYLEHFRVDEHARLRDALEAAVTREPNHADAWAALSRLYEHEFSHGQNPRPHAPERARQAADRAIELNPLCQEAWEALASAHFFGRDRAGLRAAAERVIALNPLNASGMGFMAMTLAWAGDWERGLELVRQAMTLNPHHAGWYHFVTAMNHYRLGQFEEALNETKRVNMPHLQWTHTTTAVVAGQLGRRAEAQAAIDVLRRTTPALLDLTVAREALARWFWDASLVDSMIDGCRKALALVDAPEQLAAHSGMASAPARSAPSAVAPRRGGVFSITVRPFACRTPNEECGIVGTGLTDDIAVALSKFQWLTVVPQDGRFVIEGTVRKAGSTMRVGVQLLDTEQGGQLWAETYDRDLAHGTFAVQDDLTSRIVSTIADPSGILARITTSLVADRPIAELSIEELYHRFHAYVERFRPDDHAELRTALERALHQQPRYAAGWGSLTVIYAHEILLRANPLPDTNARVRAAAERAMDLAPALQPSWVAAALAAFVDRDDNALTAACDRAVAINPLNSRSVATMAILLSWAGHDDRASELVTRATAINPNYPRWYMIVSIVRHCRRGDFETALRDVKAVNMPSFVWPLIIGVSAAGHVGRAAEARMAFDALSRTYPELITVETVRAELSLVFWEPTLVDRLVTGFEKALALLAA